MEWKKFDWNYEKQFYDIKLKDWTIIKTCWPNAWLMNRTDWITWNYWVWECEIRPSES